MNALTRLHWDLATHYWENHPRITNTWLGWDNARGIYTFITVFGPYPYLRLEPFQVSP